jgi:hypothetical protein
MGTSEPKAGIFSTPPSHPDIMPNRVRKSVNRSRSGRYVCFGSKAHIAPLIDHLIGASEQRQRWREAKRLSRI